MYNPPPLTRRRSAGVNPAQPLGVLACQPSRDHHSRFRCEAVQPRMASVNGYTHGRSTSGECPDNFTGEFPARPHWGSYPSSGYGIIEPTCNVQAICIAVPGAASAYRLHSVDCKGDTARFLEVSYPTFWNVKAVLIFQAKPAVRAPICVCM